VDRVVDAIEFDTFVEKPSNQDDCDAVVRQVPGVSAMKRLVRWTIAWLRRLPSRLQRKILIPNNQKLATWLLRWSTPNHLRLLEN
jgi:hypothetical protein